MEKVKNLAGGKAYAESVELEFVSMLLTSFMDDKYYRTATEGKTRLDELLDKMDDKRFAAKTAIFARNEFGMRSISHVVASEIAGRVKGEEWTKSFFEKIVRRVDDMSEILTYYAKKYGKNGVHAIPNSVKKGFAKAFNSFDDYQLAKYQGKSDTVSLIDIVNLIRPVPSLKNRTALQELVKGTLKEHDTWESELSRIGTMSKSKEEKKTLIADAWSRLIRNRKLGYFAALRNARNILEQASNVIDEYCDYLIDEKLIRKSLILPFRFSTAYDQIDQIGRTKNIQKVKEAISNALDISCGNVCLYNDPTLVVADYSGSMGLGLSSARGKASVLGVVLAKSNNADFMIFGSTAAYIPLDREKSTLEIVKWLDTLNGYRGGKIYNVGHDTNFHSIFKTANKQYGRIIILSDMQGWVGRNTPNRSFAAYKKKFNCAPYIYSIDVVGYGTLQFPEEKVLALAGFSEKIFDIMKSMEMNKEELFKRIENVEL